jgi:hypothetical protein
MKRLFLLLLLLATLPRQLTAQGSPKYYWYYYVVDRTPLVGAFATLVYDQKGLPHIAYGITGGKLSVKHARFDGTSWQITEVDPKGEGRIKMALDNSDNPQIVYQKNDATDVMLASYNGTQWSTRLVDRAMGSGQAFYDRAVQVDQKGRIHVCYGIDHRVGNNNFVQMTYAYFDGPNSSVHNRIDSVSHNGKWCSMILDGQERPTVAYYATGKADLAFAFLDQGAWKVEYVDNDGFQNNQGFYPYIKLGTDNQFYISFHSQSTAKLRLAQGVPGAWKLEDITTLTGWTFYSTPSPLVLDEQNNPHVAFYDTDEGSLKLAYKISDTWHIETVDTVGFAGEYASLAWNPEGMPAISYIDRAHGYLHLAVGSLTPPADTDQDNLPDYLESASNTDSLDRDSDDDGLSDGEEDLNHNGLVEAYELDPNNPDADGDGIPDGVELGRVAGVASLPGIRGTDPARFSGDTDSSTQTNPVVADTDGDGLQDGEEDKNANGRVDLDEADPNNPDTEGDGLTDGLEKRLGTSPLDLDSDDDGIADNDEEKNSNGILDDGETNPGRADTDGDTLPDGLELGVTAAVADPDGNGRFLATDPLKFLPDTDPATTTNPRKIDTDADGLKDGEEDKNRNGRLEAGETNPLNPDSDGDGLRDGIEISIGTNPLDLDMDDDGLADGLEDVNQNGTVEANETSPRLFDSEGDGVGDGVELGVTAGVPDPDAGGPLSATNNTVFKPDTDPAVNSNPLLWDTDHDGLSDGEEDTNRNGAAGPGETHFLKTDTDSDGLSDGDEKSFKSDPLVSGSKAAIVLLFKDSFASANLQNWTVVDEGNIESPSDWFAYDSTLIQSSNIWGGADTAGARNPNKPGTYIWRTSFKGTRYKLTCKIRSNDDDELGLIFQYRDSRNYYRFSMNSAQSYRRVTKIVAGNAAVIARHDFAYQKDRLYEIMIYVVDGRIQIYLDGRRIFDLQDQALPNGSVGFYCWKNAGASFKDLVVTGQGTTVGVQDIVRDFSLLNASSSSTLRWKIVPSPNIARGEIRRNTESGSVLLASISLSPDSSTQLITGEHRDDQPWLAKSYELVIYDSGNNVLDKVTLENRETLIRDFSLSPAFPNPAAGQSTVMLQSPAPAAVRYEIVDLLGRSVRVVELGRMSAGWNRIDWDGRDQEGKSVPAGLYFMRVLALRDVDSQNVVWQVVRKIARLQN